MRAGKKPADARVTILTFIAGSIPQKPGCNQDTRLCDESLILWIESITLLFTSLLHERHGHQRSVVANGFVADCTLVGYCARILDS
jgi:hypothetical protein